jgi:hypothetical protein
LEKYKIPLASAMANEDAAGILLPFREFSSGIKKKL